MTEELVISHCSPTMAGMKTGSLFTCPAEERNVLTENIRQFNSSLVPGGIRMLPVKYMGCRVLIYMYRPEKLAEDLKDKAAKEILEEKNYPVDHVDRCVVELVRRLNGKEEFPHEIGRFIVMWKLQKQSLLSTGNVPGRIVKRSAGGVHLKSS